MTTNTTHTSQGPATMQIATVTAGLASVIVNGHELGSVERSDGDPTPREGEWFGWLTPSSADMMASQTDRAARAQVWAPTRQGAAEALLTYATAQA